MGKKIYKAKLHILTPLIIHTGESFEVLELLPLREKKEVYIIDTAKAFALMSDEEKNKYYELLKSLSGNVEKDKKNLKNVRAMIQNVALKHEGVYVAKATASQNFIEEIEKNPYAVIYKIFKDALTQKPFIPGSTIKGALRTMILEQLRTELKIDKPNENIIIKENFKNGKTKKNKFKPTDFEMHIMKNNKNAILKIGDDPFRFMKVSDFHCDQKMVYFDTIRVIGKDKSQKGIPIYTEMTVSLHTHKIDCVATGTISIDEDKLEEFCKKVDLKNINTKFTKEEILKSIREFCKKIIENKKHPLPADVNKLIGDNLKNGKAALRLGRFTQIESKTFKIERDKVSPKNINIVGGVSRSLIGGTIPAGWCCLEIEN